MAETVHLFLKLNKADIKGDSLQTSLGREGSIEIVSLEGFVTGVRELGAALSTGRRKHEPLKVRKRIDKATPLISKALCNNEVAEGTFKFYRPDPAGGGTTDQFFSIEIKGGRVFSQRLILPDCIDPTNTHEPPM